MKKPLIAFAAIFVVAFGMLAAANMGKIDNNAAIAKSPAFVLATPEGIMEKTKKGNKTYQVKYNYMADGKIYKIDTEWFDTAAEAEAMAASPVQVAYATTAPDKGIFKTEFDQRDPKAGKMGAMASAAGTAVIIGILGALALLWQFPWFRRD